MTTDSQPSEQPESTAKFGYGRFVRVGPVRLFTPAEREELDRNPSSLPPTTDSPPSEQSKSTAKFGYGKFVRIGPVRLFTPEEQEEWDRNSPSSGDESDREEPPSATD